MKVFHLISNHRWTERSEPAADMACGQAVHGAIPVVLCGTGNSPTEDSVVFRAGQKGLSVLKLKLPKHFAPIVLWRDARTLRRLIAQHRPDVIHTHMKNAALTTAFALRPLHRRPLWMHSCYEPEASPDIRRLNFSFIPRMDGMLVISKHAKDHVVSSGFLPEERVAIVEPGIDVRRFRDRDNLPGREAFNLQPEDFVLGMVLRAREHRRIDLVLYALRDLLPDFGRLKLLHIGRGAVADCIEKPAEQLGIREHIVLGGYCRDDRLVTAYRAMDAMIYLVSGTDPSCRTVKEAMAAGTPVIASDQGHLPALVAHGENGYIVNMTADAVAEAVADLARHPLRRIEMARNAADVADARFARETQGRTTLDLYARLQAR